MATVKEYNVGQVVYVILQKEGKVYPMQVVEAITKKTMKGTEKNYVLRGNPSSAQTVMMTDIANEVFDTSEDARKALIDRASRQINKLVDLAVKTAQKWFPNGDTAATPEVQGVVNESLFVQDDPESDDVIKVTLGDGTVARLKQPAPKA